MCFCLLLAGCGGVNVDKTVEILAEEAEYYPIPAQATEQTAKIDVKSTEEQVGIYVIKTDDKDKVQGIISTNPHPPEVLGVKVGLQGSLETKLPANTPAMIVVKNMARRPTNVHIKVNVASK
jgi:hypothetical protein